MDIALPVGMPASHTGPISRFVPPMDIGVIEQLLDTLDLPGSRVLDPFGVSPRVPIEAAKSGRAVVVIANNPISRFILEHTLNPFTLSELRAALAQIAALPKDDTRMENFMLDLYRSRCARCGEEVSVDFFVWDRELGGPSHKVYACENCAHAGEVSATDEDWERALDYARRGLHHAMAVEQVAPRGDPDRKHAEAALAVYPGRAIYAITTLLNKVQQLRLAPGLEAAVHALLLSAFDAGNALWGYPDGRDRPRQLVASQRYREFNLWRAMEEAIGSWAMDDPQVSSTALMPGGRLEGGRVHIFHGSYTRLNELLGSESFDHVVSVPPRPNQAFWTLSALWAAWLWGHAAAAPIKVALRRRRYDWAWHAGALHTVVKQIAPMLKPPARTAMYLPESEAGFLAAILSSYDAAGYDLHGRALRANEGQAVILWQQPGSIDVPPRKQLDATRLGQACRQALETRCEPASFDVVHAAGWTFLAREHYTRSLWDVDTRQMMQSIAEILNEALSDEATFCRLGRGVELETGLYWIANPPDCGLSLSDRVEQFVLDTLRREPELQLEVLDRRICESLTGLQTPGKRLVLAALESYAAPVRNNRWALRPEDHPAARRRACQDVRHELIVLGEQLGYAVGDRDLVEWREGGELRYRFLIRETAILSDLQLRFQEPLTLVMPGGRAALLAEKSRRDPRIRDWLQSGPGILKFRHVRRLASETTLTRANLAERLAIDPPEHQDPQLPLL
ncbi:MAG: hypothetical protein P1P76_09230 [Anaerolineales bacterium]|nr:hypothetical protein [Anaerolineales bacterium]